MSTLEERVRAVITASGLTQAEFAQSIDLDVTKLSKSLNGKRRFSSADLAYIAEAGGVSVDYLLTGDEPGIALAARVNAPGSSKQAVAVAQDFAVRREGLAELGYPQGWRLPEAVPLRGRWVDQGAALAESALAFVAQAGASTAIDLIDLVPLVFGIDVAVQELGEGFDGLSVASDAMRLILVSPTPFSERQRFTIAHELGHLLASDDQQIHTDADIYSEASKMGESEMRANAFAASFLMPEDDLRKRAWASELDFCDAVADLKVSPKALAWRLHNLRLIDDPQRSAWSKFTTAQALTVVHRQRSTLSPRSLMVSPPPLLFRDTMAAYRAGDITLRPLAQLMKVSSTDLRRQLEELGSH